MTELDVTNVPAALAPFVDQGLLGPAEVRAATTLCRIANDNRPEALLGAAVAVRAPGVGSVCAVLSQLPAAALPIDDLDGEAPALPWPAATEWAQVLAGSPLTNHGPLVLEGDLLYLARLHHDEIALGTALLARARRIVEPDATAVAALASPLFPQVVDPADRQHVAAVTAARRALSLVVGGPGTGKTTTIGRVLALVAGLAVDRDQTCQVALAAPTARAANRLQEAIRRQLETLPLTSAVRDMLAPDHLEAVTLHRMIGLYPGKPHARHDQAAPVPHDVVVVDEVSMASLSMMARVVDAVRRDARLVLVGDPDQLASVEAGTVLRDVVGPVSRDLRRSPNEASALTTALGGRAHDAVEVADGGLHDAVTALTVPHRFGRGSGIDALARAIRDGDLVEVAAVLDDAEDVTHLDDIDAVRKGLLDNAVARAQAAAAGDLDQAQQLLGRVQVLAAHRLGLRGVSGWNARMSRWLDTALERSGWAEWWPGDPVLVTQTDRSVRVSNGDVGVVMLLDGVLRVAIPDREGVPLSPARLDGLARVHALTIHKSQGSQYEHVIVSLPENPSRILSRELLYTAVTRATKRLTILGSRAVIDEAIGTRIKRSSGLSGRLWTGSDPLV